MDFENVKAQMRKEYWSSAFYYTLKGDAYATDLL